MNILKVAIKDNILQIHEIHCDRYLINKEVLANSFTHHTIRLKNILRVILNEILAQDDIVNMVKDLLLKKEFENNIELAEILKCEEKEEFENSYEKFENNKDIKAKDIGTTNYFENINSNSCVIVVHGFSSAPKEMQNLALFLNENNFNVITPRLSGHGTVPEDLKTKTWQDWYKSVSRSITIASLQYKKVYIVGFSTGGLLALLSTKKQYKEFVSLVCINAALHLNDLRIKTLLPAISFWNDIVKVFNENKYAKEYIDNFPENPQINYNKHYVSSIEQLSLLMDKIKKNLHKIKKPILIIQGKDDPVVNPSSAHEIYEKIESRFKKLKMINSSKHVIVNENTDGLYDYILSFINEGKL